MKKFIAVTLRTC